VPNPKSKGPWRAKKIPNPAYKGEWAPRKIANPDYKPDDKLYLLREPIANVGIDVWQVKSGSIFDNIIIGDSLDDVNAIVDKTWKATKDAEKAADEAAKKEAEKASAESKKDEEKSEDL
jgi:calreticulin